MNSKPLIVIALIPVLFSGCDTGRKSSAGAPQVKVEVPPAPPAPNQGIEIPLQFTGKNFASDIKIAQFEYAGGGLKIVNTSLADSHLLSEPVALKTSETYIIDRKSTRLNSSHVEISYAVFCLKKKKK